MRPVEVLEELVVLLDESGREIGTAPKLSVHDTDTALHLAFSCHVLNPAGEVLVTRRALSKRTWPGVWTNSFCGHPLPGEEFPAAIERRALFELGLSIAHLTVTLPDFRYRAVDSSGIVENEICPVYLARATGEPVPNPDEVMEFAWVEPAALQRSVRDAPWAFSPWLGLQLQELTSFDA
ncbi:isopentenyl-diphosphate Delta-isomerase [Cryobacterium sp. TMT2-17-1]|uniref:isopentenyl-diphosphate Delta-isomerase n=1 Tax=unclassified Cryobacterium TaxID=2649013 RepID=UPI00106AF13E|nr:MULTISPECIES: isopentenyl-diphosphate Delta-isomerase [unclassified Cryobacterium]TFB60478.1 isopentenyl-diphosphate Delta-isomerase [Cryobacterium sp. Sr3]TFC54328.1 isopentenyl-diphosphate Delta-isomerase [Cryobacterium sp. TMT2-17-1]